MDLNDREKLLLLGFIVLIIIAKSRNRENFVAPVGKPKNDDIIANVMKVVDNLFTMK
jgi:hypothetical protein